MVTEPKFYAKQQLTLSAPAAANASVDFELQATASSVSGTDFDPLTGTVNFAEGENVAELQFVTRHPYLGVPAAIRILLSNNQNCLLDEAFRDVSLPGVSLHTLFQDDFNATDGGLEGRQPVIGHPWTYYSSSSPGENPQLVSNKAQFGTTVGSSSIDVKAQFAVTAWPGGGTVSMKAKISGIVIDTTRTWSSLYFAMWSDRNFADYAYFDLNMLANQISVNNGPTSPFDFTALPPEFEIEFRWNMDDGVYCMFIDGEVVANGVGNPAGGVIDTFDMYTEGLTEIVVDDLIITQGGPGPVAPVNPVFWSDTFSGTTGDTLVTHQPNVGTREWQADLAESNVTLADWAIATPGDLELAANKDGYIFAGDDGGHVLEDDIYMEVDFYVASLSATGGPIIDIGFRTTNNSANNTAMAIFRLARQTSGDFGAMSSLSFHSPDAGNIADALAPFDYDAPSVQVGQGLNTVRLWLTNGRKTLRVYFDRSMVIEQTLPNAVTATAAWPAIAAYSQGGQVIRLLSVNAANEAPVGYPAPAEPLAWYAQGQPWGSWAQITPYGTNAGVYPGYWFNGRIKSSPAGVITWEHEWLPVNTEAVGPVVQFPIGADPAQITTEAAWPWGVGVDPGGMNGTIYGELRLRAYVDGVKIPGYLWLTFASGSQTYADAAWGYSATEPVAMFHILDNFNGNLNDTLVNRIPAITSTGLAWREPSEPPYAQFRITDNDGLQAIAGTEGAPMAWAFLDLPESASLKMEFIIRSANGGALAMNNGRVFNAEITLGGNNAKGYLEDGWVYAYSGNTGSADVQLGVMPGANGASLKVTLEWADEQVVMKFNDVAVATQSTFYSDQYPGMPDGSGSLYLEVAVGNIIEYMDVKQVPPPTGILLRDTFTGATPLATHESDTGSTWLVHPNADGTEDPYTGLHLVGGKLIADNHSGSQAMALPDLRMPTGRAHYVQFNLMFPPGAGNANSLILYRADTTDVNGMNNATWLSEVGHNFNPNEIYLYGNVASVGAQPITDGVPIALRYEFDGASLVVKLNGVTIMTDTDAMYQSLPGGFLGFKLGDTNADQTQMDNYEVGFLPTP